VCSKAWTVLLCLLIGAIASAQRDATERAAWNQPIKPFRIVGNVYYVGVAGLSSFLIKTPAGDVLLDGGLPESAPRIAASLAELGVRLADVKVLINSHAHFDHAGGLAELERSTGARMVASAADAESLAAGRSESFGAATFTPFPAVRVDRVIADGGTVELGGTVLTAHLTPGHTKGCTTWTMPVLEAGKKHEVVFHCSTTAPGYQLVDNPKYPQIVADYRRSFATLRKLPCDVFLGPHPSFFHFDEKRARLGTAGPNPFVDPGEWARFIDESERAFDDELQRQRAERK
jgi:metallo-beta-lactamase class B